MWDIFILNPMINALLLLYSWLGQNFVLSIIVFTVLVRLVTFPLMFQQQRSTRAMQTLQPRMKELQKKYKDDKEGLLQAQQKLYAEAGVNPLAGCLPTLIQFPILIGLYQAIIQSLAAAPNQLLDLAHRVYTIPPFTHLTTLIPLQNQFLGLNLGQPPIAPLNYGVAAIVFGTSYLQQKLITPATQSADKDDTAAQMTNTMQYMMPLMFGMFALQFAAGLSIYFIVSNLLGIIQFWFTNRSQPALAAAGAAGVGSKSLAVAASDGVRPEANGRKKEEADKTLDRPAPTTQKPSAKAAKRRASKSKK